MVQLYRFLIQNNKKYFQSSKQCFYISLLVIIGLLFFPFLPTIWDYSIDDENINEVETFQESDNETDNNLARIKGWFTENNGQIENSDVKYTYSVSDLSIGFIESGYLIKLTNEEKLTSVVTVTFGGANQIIPIGREEQSHKSNYFIGNDSTKWRNGVRNYDKIVYEELYDGIDLVFFTSEMGLKYDFIISPSVDPHQIRWSYDGVKEIDIASDGDLHISTPTGEFIEEVPISYQYLNGEVILIPSHYLCSENGVTFNVGKYDNSTTLIIDPLIYSTFIGGSGSETAGESILDQDNNLIFPATTYSIDFPTTQGCYDNNNAGGRDIVIFKMNPDGSDLIFSTFIGGSAGDFANSVNIDRMNNVYVTGQTGSEDFPTTENASDTTLNGDNDIIVCKFNDDGSELIFSTFIGGDNEDGGDALQLDNESCVYVSGFTDSEDFPTTIDAFDTTHNGYFDNVVFKLNPNGSDLEYSTYIGGSDGEGSSAIMIDGEKNIYLASESSSNNFPTTEGCYDDTYNDSDFIIPSGDVVLCKVNSDGSALEYSTYIGGTSMDRCNGITIDDKDNVYVSGYTTSDDFPTTEGCYDNTHGGVFDIFIAKMNVNGSRMEYGTYIGGSGSEIPLSITITLDQMILFSGWTLSIDFPTTEDCYDNTPNGGSDCVFGKLNENGSELLYSSYLGGEGRDSSRKILIDQENQETVFIIGGTESPDFPTSPDCFDQTYNGGSDLFAIKFQFTQMNIAPVVHNVSTEQYTIHINDTVTITGNGWDGNNPEKIKSVELSIDSGPWILVNNTEDWDYDWNTSSFSLGKHTLIFRAYDGERYSENQTLILFVEKRPEVDDRYHPPPTVIAGVIVVMGLFGLLSLSFFREDVRYYLYSILTIPLYSRLETDEILAQPNRQKINNWITNSPGIYLTKLSREIGLGIGTLIHHLNILEKEHHIYSKKEKGMRLFYPKNGTFEPEDQVEKVLLSPNQESIIRYLKENGSSSRKKMEEALIINPNTIKYALRRLRQWELITKKGRGKYVKYQIKDD